MTAIDQDPSKTIRLARLRVWRGTNRDSGRYEEFDVEFEDGDSVLDGLVRLRVNSDPTLAIRYSCFNANVCKECTMLIDGAVEYACFAKLQPRVMQIDPLPNLEIVRDLVTDTLSRKERF